MTEWEKLDMTSLERRKLCCSITFHIVAITCVVWSLYVLIGKQAHIKSDWSRKILVYLFYFFIFLQLINIHSVQNKTWPARSHYRGDPVRGAAVAVLDQTGGRGHRLHRRPRLHVHPVQSLHSDLQKVESLQ